MEEINMDESEVVATSNNDDNKFSFKDFNFSKNLASAIDRLGFTVPTEIQEKAIPLIIDGKDVVGESATGSGKTLAFGAGVIEYVKPKGGVQALILVPTRELAEQVTKEIKTLSNGKLRLIAIYGGVSINPQMDALRSSEIVVATPGRLMDHMERKTIDLSRVSMLVLDEADRMLDMGFVDDIERILRACPKQRQSLFFSATFPSQIQSLIKKYMVNPAKVKVRNQVDPKLLKQEYYDVKRNMKLSLLVHLIKEEKSNNIMVFCNTRQTTDLIVNNLIINKVKAAAIHGGFTQSSRLKVLDNFKVGKIKTLVCTDVAARGIHVDSVSHVYNYDVPKDPNDYIHRIGRTARAGSDGKVINLISEVDHDNFSKIFRNYDFNISKVQLPLNIDKIKISLPSRAQEKSRGRFGERDGSNRVRGGSQRRSFGSRGGSGRNTSGSDQRRPRKSFSSRSNESNSSNSSKSFRNKSRFRNKN